MTTITATTEPEANPTASSANTEIWRRRSFWRPVLRGLLASNPFYIGSAALLLYSMRCLSLDSQVFKREVTQLFFNFSSFQVYEILLVATGIVLARRKIWYDAGLLIMLENMFVCVPLILVSQALLLEDHIALAFCLTACVLAAARVGALKKWVSNVNLPARALAIGGGLLAANIGLPVLIRALHKDANFEVWSNRGAVLNAVEWFGIAPLAMGLGLLLAGEAPTGRARGFFTWRSFPLVALTLWVAGTCAHLYCIGYVYGLSWGVSLAVPAVWVAGWLYFVRRAELDFVPEVLRNHFEKLLLTIPALALALAIYDWNGPLCLTLASISAVIYLLVGLGHGNRWALFLSLASAGVATGSLPQHLMLRLGPGVTRPGMVLAGILACVVASAFVSKNPRMAIAGAIAASMFAMGLSLDHGGHLGVQVGLVFLLLHSLRWDDALNPDARGARRVAAVGWLVNSALWMAGDPTYALNGAVATGGFVLLAYVAARLIFGTWGARVIPVAAATVMLLQPALAGERAAVGMPSGVLILVASFVLFGLGTLVALTKDRWAPAIQEGCMESSSIRFSAMSALETKKKIMNATTDAAQGAKPQKALWKQLLTALGVAFLIMVFLSMFLC